MGKRFLPLQPPHSTPYYAFIYLTIFFVCVSKSYWLSFIIPYAAINGVLYIIIKINSIKSLNENQHKIYGQNRHYVTFAFIAALQYISMWQSIDNTSYCQIDYIIIFFLCYSHFCVFITSMHFHFNLFAKFQLYRICIGWISDLHHSTILYSLYIFPFYPITSLCLFNGTMDQNQHKYAVILLYVILYCYILYSLLSSINHKDPNKWTYYKIDTKSNHLSKDVFTPVKYNEYFIGNDIKSNHSKYVLRICQISDCHLDSFYAAKELRALCKNIVHFDPDLVLLTGDYYYTGNDDIPKGLLKYALSPLIPIANKCYGCLGNHDLKTMQTKDDIVNCVEMEFNKLGIKLLRNESVLHNEFVEIIGFDYVKYNGDNKRRNMMKTVLNKSELKCANDKKLRIVLLHNPEHFDNFDGDEGICCFSGHIHGGHVGFYILGSSLLHWFRDTSFYRLMRGGLPDYGVWKKGSNYLYIHRGNTLYSKKILRFGVPAENQSCVLIN